MIIFDCTQGSPEWLAARCGIPTASNFDKIITPGKGEPSKSAAAYGYKLLAEKLTGAKEEEEEPNEWMLRGIELEAEARSLYEIITGAEVKQAGLVYRNEDRDVACSPDGLLTGKGLEIKCPAPHTHVEYLLNGVLPTKYIAQVQGSMWVTGIDEWDFLSYHPVMPPLLITVERDDKFIAKLAELVADFNAGVEESYKRIMEMRK